MLFTLDVGSGTQDFLLYSDENIRNCLKVILPSPTRIVGEKIRRSNADVYLYGYTMGGGAVTAAVREHLAKGYRVFATERAARTFADDVEKVKKMGVIVGRPRGRVVAIETRDVDLRLFSKILGSVGYEMPELFGIAVQDHGFSPHESNRVFRFRAFERRISKDSRLASLVFRSREIPEEFNRMRDAAACVTDEIDAEVYVVDTAFAAIAGCAAFARLPALLVNFGNSHITAAVVDEDMRIAALLEHHTSVMLKRGTKAIREMLESFKKGKLNFEDVFRDGGHGCFVRETLDVVDEVCTGPNAWVSDIRQTGGDPMIVGNLGIILLLSELGVVEMPKVIF
ncbi:MAG: DUF1786 family protein [Archaeoglobaceae archaeon]